MKNNIGYDVDFFNDKIILSKKFAKAACILGSSEYNTLMMLRKDNPNFTIELREIKKKTGKKTYRHLTFEVMEEMIIRLDGEGCKNLAIFEAVKVQAKLQPSPYAYVKKWFLNHYKESMEQLFTVENQKSEEDQFCAG